MGTNTKEQGDQHAGDQKWGVNWKSLKSWVVLACFGTIKSVMAAVFALLGGQWAETLLVSSTPFKLAVVSSVLAIFLGFPFYYFVALILKKRCQKMGYSASDSTLEDRIKTVDWLVYAPWFFAIIACSRILTRMAFGVGLGLAAFFCILISYLITKNYMYFLLKYYGK